MIPLPAFPLWGQSEAPELEIAVSALRLQWPETEEAFILVESEGVESPWIPSLVRITQHMGHNQAVVPSIGQGLFFGLAPGTQFSNDFSLGGGWRSVFANPPDSDKFDFEYNGALRVTVAPDNRAVLGQLFYVPEPEVTYVNVTMALDVLNWEPRLDNQTVGLVARSVDFNSVPAIGLITFADTDYGRTTQLTFCCGSSQARERVALDAEKDYRLVFSVVGTSSYLSLFDLEDLSTAVASVSTTSETIMNSGLVGIWIDAGDHSYDITVDNFIVTGTTP